MPDFHTSSADAHLLELTHATVKKNDVTVLDDVSLSVREGEHTAIIGPNGSGKSTLVNIVMHQDRASTGEGGLPSVRVFGRSSWVVSDLRAHLGVVSADAHQRFVAGNSLGRIRALDAVLSGFFGSHGVLQYYDVTKEMHQRAVYALERVGTAHLAGAFLDEMSTGEMRRVLIARAIVAGPRALVLDEPSSGLDVVGRFRLMEMVANLGGQGTTIILVTHHVEEIIPAIERVILLKGGRVVQIGPKRDVLQSETLTALFGAPIEVEEVDGYFHTQVRSLRSKGK